MGIRRKIKRLVPYWLTGKEERCAGCDERHAHGLTAHCAACDRGFCPLCVVVIDGEVFCTDCQGEGGER